MLGLAVGQIVGGVITTAGGVTGELLGGAASVTGLGAAVGVPALVVSTGLVVGGVGNIAAGIQGLSQSLMSTGAGNSGPQALPAARGAASETKATIHFGRVPNQVSHAFRHTDAVGLERSAVQAAVEGHLRTVESQIVVGKPFNQIIEVAGTRIQYTAFQLPDGVINVGRIHPVP